MPRHPLFLAAVCTVALGLAGPVRAEKQPDPPDGFRPLFNGEDLSGWHARHPHQLSPGDFEKLSEEERAEKLADWMKQAREHWTVEEGELVNDGHGPYLTTDEEFGDMELLIDYKTVPKADSGIYLRGTPQVQIWDPTQESGRDLGAHKGSGGLWNNSEASPGKYPRVLADKPFGEWNHFRIRQVGARTSVWLNGKHVVDHAIMENYWNRDRPLVPEGPIQLQTHGGEIRWRNIAVREIPAEEANRILAKKNDDGFEPIFNGRDMTGWSGAVDAYEAKDGALVCQPDHGGTIYTDEEYADFVARMEIRIPPGGNNGLAIRYPGEGNPAYDGLCELQVLDNKSGRHRDLDPRQFHGSAYGMVAAHQGYLRPAGEWNFQEVTVQGTRVRVELNGYVILEADLSELNEFMGDRPHPGKNREKGHFGFAGHGDPVAFRNIRIKRLPSGQAESR